MMLKMSSPFFTWERGLEGLNIIQEKLGRYVCNAAWFDAFKSYKACNMVRQCSDHSPILLSMLKKPVFVGDLHRGRRL